MKKSKVSIYIIIIILNLVLCLSSCTETTNDSSNNDLMVNNETNNNQNNEDGEGLVLIEETESSEETNSNNTEGNITEDSNSSQESNSTQETDPSDSNEEAPINIEATELDGYYKEAYNLNAKALKDILNDIITENHATLSYSQVYTALEETDEDPNDPSKVVLFYKGVSVPDNELRMSDDGDIWNREHIWAKSHGDFGTTRGPGTDIHMIRPTDASVNTRRGHLDFDESDDVFKEAPDTYADDDSFEPRDEVKGDVARMIFYMAVRYEGEDGEVDLEISNRTDTYYLTDTGYGEHGKLDTLLKWHEEDPVDEFEIRRNNIIQNIQGNRNPFIDHPEYVGRIWGDAIVIEPTEDNTKDDSEVNIEEIGSARIMQDGKEKTISGVITYIDSNTTLYIQDETGGIRVDSYGSDVNLNSYEIGNIIIVTGELDTYKGEKEIKVSKNKSITILDEIQQSEPKEVEARHLLENDHQGELIQLINVEVVKVENNIFRVKDDYGYVIEVYFGNNSKFDEDDVKTGDTVNIIGIASWYNNMQVKLITIN